MKPEDFNKIEKLYHYTSFESAYKILTSKTLIYGRLSDMNDINEAHRQIFYDQKNATYEEIFNELNSYGQISLTIDDKRKGYAIPAMWGHYANKGCGVCIVFDKNKLLDCLPDDATFDYINYDPDYDSDISCVEPPVAQFFKDHLKELFFEKTDDWSYEQEFRIIKKIHNHEKLNLKDSIIAVIVHSDKDTEDGIIWNSTSVKILEKLCKDIQILDFAKWVGEDELIDKDGKNWLNDDTIFKIDI